MKLSLIIPVYNVEKYIGKCLQSIINQNVDLSEFEIVVINDGTLDSSMDKVREILNNYPNIIIYNKDNEGLSVARNTGLCLAHGDYVWFIDSDDWIMDNSLSIILEKIKQNPNVDVFASVLNCYNDNAMKQESCSWIANAIITGKIYMKAGYRLGAVPRFVMSRKFLLDNNLYFYPRLLHEDGLFGHSMMYYAQKVMCLKESLYIYRLAREGSIMNSVSIKNIQACISIHKKLIAFMNEKVSDNDKIWYRKNIFICIISLFRLLKNIGRDEAKLFMEKNGEYIKSECDACLELGNIRWNVKLLLIKYFPFLYIRFFN